MYLLDTNVVSEMRKLETPRLETRGADTGLQRWLSSLSVAECYLSSISILEIQVGILRLARKDPAQAEILRRWLHDRILPSFADRVLAIDSAIALRCAELHVPVTVAYYDALIAATALLRGLTVVTRNVKDFEPMGVRVLNPWQG